MRLFGSLSELAAILFRKNGFSVTARPNAGTTYTANRDVQIPPGDQDSILVGESNTQTLTNKTLTAPAITSPSGLTKSDVGLSNVDNTSDATKNSATATLTNKTLTAPVINSPTGLVKADVGLSNVDNTSDATKNAAAVTLTNKTLTAPVISNFEDLTEIASPATPASGELRLYAKADHLPYIKDSLGVETSLIGSLSDASFSQAGRVNLTTQDLGAGVKSFRNGLLNIGFTRGNDPANSTITLTAADNPTQIFTSVNGGVNVLLPPNVRQGSIITLVTQENNGLLDVKAADATSIIPGAINKQYGVLYSTGYANYMALVDNPATQSDWMVIHSEASGSKTLTTATAGIFNAGKTSSYRYDIVNNQVTIVCNGFSTTADSTESFFATGNGSGGGGLPFFPVALVYQPIAIRVNSAEPSNPIGADWAFIEIAVDGTLTFKRITINWLSGQTNVGCYPFTFVYNVN